MADPGVPRQTTLTIRLKEIAEITRGKLVGNGDLTISGACGLEEASSEDLSFCSSSKFESLLKRSKAKALIVSENTQIADRPYIQVKEPAKAFLQILRMFGDGLDALKLKGIHPSSIISEKAQIGRDVYIGPGVIVEEGANIGSGTSILARTYIGKNVRIGNECLFYEQVTIRENCVVGDRVILHPGCVIGSDGFGYEMIEGRYIKVPQNGNVIIEKDVEIGASTCVDRARFGSTIIGEGTKIDNLVQIAHNVRIGKHCLLVSQVGIAGGAILGDHVILAGQVGVLPKVEIGNGTRIGAQSGVHVSIDPNLTVLGSPPRPIKEELSLIVYRSKLPEIFKDVKQIKQKLGL